MVDLLNLNFLGSKSNFRGTHPVLRTGFAHPARWTMSTPLAQSARGVDYVHSPLALCARGGGGLGVRHFSIRRGL
jgi:hypothetical protein